MQQTAPPCSPPLHGRIAMVTGASRGLGRAIAQRFIEDGAHLIVTGRDPITLAAAAAHLNHVRRGTEQRIVDFAADVSDPQQVEALFQVAQQQFDRLDVVVCNAGIQGPIGALESVDWAQWVRTVEVNLLGTALCCRAAVTVMRPQRAGKIVTLSGGGATSPRAHMSAYAASKAAVVRLTESLAEETRADGIDINSVAPGALNTDMLEELLAQGPERLGFQAYERALEQKAGGGDSLKAAVDLIAFLASPESDGITGRLLSAVWDNWRRLPDDRTRLASSDVFTLRRIVPEDRGWSLPG